MYTHCLFEIFKPLPVCTNLIMLTQINYLKINKKRIWEESDMFKGLTY